MVRRLVFFVAFAGLVGCAASRLSVETAKDCESFAEVDARAKEELDTLLATAPGEVLVRESSRLNLARRACARHRIGLLLELREKDGVQSAQQEIDALVRAWNVNEVRALIVEQVGDAAIELEPLLQEATQRVAREASAASLDARDEQKLKELVVTGPSRLGPEPQLPQTMCHELTPCAQLECVAREGADTDDSARACLDTLAPLEPERRAAQLRHVLELLRPGPSGPRTEAMLQLERLRVAVWPQVKDAVQRGKQGLAAQLATPFAVLPSVAAEVAALRDRAQAVHLARAKEKESQPEVQWFHRALAASFGGPAVEGEAAAGRWEPTRWRCPGDAPELPAVPTGLSARLQVRCETKAGPPKRDEKKPEGEDPGAFMRTFDLERDLERTRAQGSLQVTCANKSSTFTFVADDREGVVRELKRSLDEAVRGCVTLHERQAAASCIDVGVKSGDELISRFVTHARYARRWEGCFTEWLQVSEGVRPPSLPPRVRSLYDAHESLIGD